MVRTGKRVGYNAARFEAGPNEMPSSRGKKERRVSWGRKKWSNRSSKSVNVERRENLNSVTTKVKSTFLGIQKQKTKVVNEKGRTKRFSCKKICNSREEKTFPK